MPDAAPAALFLSYARGDDEPFVRQLYERLLAEGHRVWWDRQNLPSRSLSFLKEIREAVRASDRVLVVIGPSCIESDYCRAEWQAALAESKPVNPVLRLGNHSLLPAELQLLHCPDVRASSDVEAGLRDLLRVLREPLPPLGPLLGGVPDVPPHFQPRPDALTALAARLLRDDLAPVTLSGPDRLCVLHGMGGLGKSVLAAAFARSTTTRRAFADGVLWLQAGPEATPLALMADLARLLGDPLPLPDTLPAAASRLAALLQPRSVLIVLDNAWPSETLDGLVDALGPAGRMLITSRGSALALALGAPAVELGLPDHACALRQLADWAGVAPDALPPEATAVARESGHLPLALALNGAMHRQGLSWADLAAALRAGELDFAEQRFKGYAHATVLSSIRLSLDTLDREDPAAGQRLRELAAFRSGATLPEAAVALLWAHSAGLSAAHVSKLLAKLAGRALIRLQPDEHGRRILLHDLQRDHLLQLTDASALEQLLLQAHAKRCQGEWALLPDDGYIHRHLLGHLRAAGRQAEAEALLDASDASGRNAWFLAHTVPGSEADYLQDLAAALPHADAARRWHLQLMQASVHGLLASLPPALQRALLNQAPASAAAALAAARATDDRLQGLQALLALLPALDADSRPPVLAECLSLARSLGHSVRALQLPRLAALCPPEQARALAQEALQSACLLPLPVERARALAAVAPWLGPAEQDAAADAAVQALLADPDAAEWCDALQAVLPLRPDAAPAALALAWQLPDPFLAAMALAALCPQLPAEGRAEAAREGIRRFEQSRANGLWIALSLARHLPDADVPGLIHQALVKDPRQIPALLQTLPELLTGEALRQALDSVRAALPGQAESARSLARIGLLPHLPPDKREAEVDDLLLSLPRLEGASSRQRAWTALIDHLSPGQRLQARRQAGRLDDRATLWLAAARLAVHAEPALRRDLAGPHWTGVTPLCRALGLAALAGCPTEPDHPQTVTAALEALWACASDPAALPGGLQLAPWLPPPERDQLLAALLDTWCALGAPLAAQQLARHAGQWPAALQEHTATRLIESARPEDLPGVVQTLAAGLTPAQRAQAWARSPGLPTPALRWLLLCHVLPGLADASREQALAELADLSSRALRFSEPADQAAACRALGRVLPALAGPLRDEFQALLLGALPQLDAAWLPGVLAAVAPVLDAPTLSSQAERALQRGGPLKSLVALHALDGPPRWAVLADSVQQLSVSGPEARVMLDLLEDSVTGLLAAPEATRQSVWEQALAQPPARRAEAALKLATLAPLGLSLRQQKVLASAAHSVAAVARWWE